MCPRNDEHRQLILNMAAGHANFREEAGMFSPQTRMLRYKEGDRASEDIGGYPCSTGKNSKKCRIQALRGLNTTSQMVDPIGVNAKFRYAAEQRDFFGRTAELNGRAAELQRNLSVPR
jgi:hypothetical protein